MPSRISSELAQLARLARDGGLDLSQVSLRVKADLLMSSPNPPQEDLDAFREMGEALIPAIDDATAVILARKLAGWRYAPASVLQALKSRGGAVIVALLRHGMPLPVTEIEALAEQGDDEIALAVAERADLTATAALILADRDMRPVDLALINNAASPLPRMVLDLLLERSRTEPSYAQLLLARPDIASADLAPLYLQAGSQRKTAIIESLTALDSFAPAERRAQLAPDLFAGWLATASNDSTGAFGAIASYVGGGQALAEAMAADTSRDLAALALTAAGASVEDATRFMIRLGDEAAHSVDRIFALVALMRLVRPAVALRIVMQVAGVRTPVVIRKGRHQPAMDPSNSPNRSGAAKPESQTLISDVMRKLGLRRENG
ncbi:hypothetical protein [Bosea sp. 685]|uniref:hypothetical protein n=1 Tax=Bosea sp. 685 TaxID=3080057 RepID=UPI0028936C6B|nr:hypothetical protein [Bosea sp. 685]WNJ89206.1 hypothetical protein RMR04_22710 [Bosea sp. 685]